MNISIFGGSFACRNTLTSNPAWFDILGERLGATSVTPFGRGGSSVFDAYKIFLENYKNFDLNIVLVTHWGQYTKEFRGTWKNGREEKIIISSLSSVEDVMKNYDWSDSSLEHLTRIKSWFIANVDEYEVLIRELMLQDIENKDPNVVLIVGSNRGPKDNLFSDERRKKQFSTGIGDYFSAQMKRFPDNGSLIERDTVMQTHFIPEASKIFADAVYQYITTDEWPPMPEVIDHEFPVEHYYTIRT